MEGAPIPAEVTLALARAAAACAPPRPRSGPDPLGAAFEAVVDATAPGERRGILGDLAERRPDLILRRATDWLTDDDAEVLVRLPEHYLRVAVAQALRPWSRRSIDEVVGALDGHVPVDLPTDATAVVDPTAVIARVMADDYPELTRPAGLLPDPLRRWRVIGCEVWEWSLWECDDGRHALEVVVSSGHTDFEVGELVDDTLVAAWLRQGPAALDEAVEQLRAKHRTTRRPG